MKIFATTLAATLSIAGGSSASATVIDFSDLATSQSYITYQSYSSNGYYFTTSPSCSDCLLTWGKTNRSNGDYNGATLGFNNNKPIVITRSDGGLFDFASLYMDDIFNGTFNLSSYDATFTFVTDAGSSTQIFTVDRSAGMQYFFVNRTLLRSVSIAGGNVQIDNLNLAASVIPTAVPEPATWAMLIAGFGLVGGTMRRRRAGICFA